MNTFRNQYRNTSFVGYVFCLTLLVFACRALIPSGFMPDLTAWQAGRLALMLCPAQGPQLFPETGPHQAGPPADLHASAGHDIRGAHDAPSKHVGHEAASKMECPFSLLAAPALIAPGKIPAAVSILFIHAFFQRVATAFRPQTVTGLPVGARAPPVSLD